MALLPKIRFLVMNRTNQVIAPRDEELDGFDPAALKASGMIPKKYSPSFRDADGTTGAKAFASALAAKYPGERFYVAQVLGGAVVESPAAWSNAVAGALHDDSTAEDLDDGQPNE